MKTRKFASKRLKLTKGGKIVFRRAGQNHFDAKESGNKTRNKRHNNTANSTDTKIFKHILN
jgi:ribosomal protein L35